MTFTDDDKIHLTELQGIGQAVQLIADLGDRASSVEEIGESRTATTYLIDGELVRVEVEPTARAHKAADVEAFVAMAMRYGFVAGVPTGAAYHSDGGVVLTCDDCCDSLRDSVVRLDLPKHRVFQLVAGLVAGKMHAHRDVVRMLRIDLRGFVPEGFAEAIASIRVTHGGSNSSTVASGRERGTAEFQRELDRTVDIPTSITARVPVYDVRDLRTPALYEAIDIMVEVDLETGRIELIADPDQVAAAIESTQSHIGTTIAEATSLPTFFGKVC